MSFSVIVLSSPHGHKMAVVVPSFTFSSNENRKERVSILSRKNILPKLLSAHLSQVPFGRLSILQQQWMLGNFSLRWKLSLSAKRHHGHLAAG